MWTRLRNFFRRWFFYTEWQHVGLFEHEMRYNHEGWQTYIHCFESNYGNRKIKIVGAKAAVSKAKEYDTDDFESIFHVSVLYQKELYPWLEGRANDKIPGFDFVKSKKFDFTKKLKGETPIVLNDDEKA